MKNVVTARLCDVFDRLNGDQTILGKFKIKHIEAYKNILQNQITPTQQHLCVSRKAPLDRYSYCPRWFPQAPGPPPTHTTHTIHTIQPRRTTPLRSLVFTLCLDLLWMPLIIRPLVSEMFPPRIVTVPIALETKFQSGSPAIVAKISRLAPRVVDV